MSSTYITKIEEELEKALMSILEKNPDLKRLQEINTIAEWYMEAREDPKRIPSIISNRIIEHLLEHVKPFFVNRLLEDISIECEIREEGVKFDLNFTLKPIRAYVELARSVNGKEIPPPIRLTFKLDTHVNVKNLEIHSSSNGIKVRLEKLVVDVQLSIVKLSLINLDEPKVLGRKEFDLKELWLYLQRKNLST